MRAGLQLVSSSPSSPCSPSSMAWRWAPPPFDCSNASGQLEQRRWPPPPQPRLLALRLRRMCARTIDHVGARTIAVAREAIRSGVTGRALPPEEIGTADAVRRIVLGLDHPGKRDPYRGVRGRGRCRSRPTSRQAWQGLTQQCVVGGLPSPKDEVESTAKRVFARHAGATSVSRPATGSPGRDAQPRIASRRHGRHRDFAPATRALAAPASGYQGSPHPRIV